MVLDRQLTVKRSQKNSYPQRKKSVSADVFKVVADLKDISVLMVIIFSMQLEMVSLQYVSC
jgi:hypothetical protein